MTFELHHARGETDDATWTFVPELRILHPGDLFIWAVPNAGNPQKVQRFASDWAAALREMAGCGAEIMLCGHGLPIFGADRVRQALTDTAELLDSIEAQTLALMNQGVPLDRVLHEVEVPEHLRELPYLQPVYDHPQFLVRNVWRRYGGWYDGEPDNLLPAPRAEQAREWVALAGGLERVLARARELAAAGDHRLACHLVEFAVLFDPSPPRPTRCGPRCTASAASSRCRRWRATSSATRPTPAAQGRRDLAGRYDDTDALTPGSDAPLRTRAADPTAMRALRAGRHRRRRAGGDVAYTHRCADAALLRTFAGHPDEWSGPDRETVMSTIELETGETTRREAAFVSRAGRVRAGARRARGAPRPRRDVGRRVLRPRASNAGCSPSACPSSSAARAPRSARWRWCSASSPATAGRPRSPRAMHQHVTAFTAWRYRRGLPGAEATLRRVAGEGIVLVSTGGADLTAPRGRADEGRRRLPGQRPQGVRQPVAGRHRDVDDVHVRRPRAGPARAQHGGAVRGRRRHRASTTGTRSACAAPASNDIVARGRVRARRAGARRPPARRRRPAAAGHPDDRHERDRRRLPRHRRVGARPCHRRRGTPGRRIRPCSARSA